MIRYTKLYVNMIALNNYLMLDGVQVCDIKFTVKQAVFII